MFLFQFDIAVGCDALGVSVNNWIIEQSDNHTTVYLKYQSSSSECLQDGIFSTLVVNSTRQWYHCVPEYTPFLTNHENYTYSCSLDLPNDMFALSTLLTSYSFAFYQHERLISVMKHFTVVSNRTEEEHPFAIIGNTGISGGEFFSTYSFLFNSTKDPILSCYQNDDIYVGWYSCYLLFISVFSYTMIAPALYNISYHVVPISGNYVGTLTLVINVNNVLLGPLFFTENEAYCNELSLEQHYSFFTDSISNSSY